MQKTGTFFGAEAGPSGSSHYWGLHGILFCDRKDAIHVMKLQYEPVAGGKSNSSAYNDINSSLKRNSITLVCGQLRDLTGTNLSLRKYHNESDRLDIQLSNPSAPVLFLVPGG